MNELANIDDQHAKIVPFVEVGGRRELGHLSLFLAFLASIESKTLPAACCLLHYTQTGRIRLQHPLAGGAAAHVELALWQS